MRKAVTLMLVFCVAILGVVAVEAQEENTSRIQGAWRVEGVSVRGGPNAGDNANPQPSIYIFAKKHYSIMFVPGEAPRPDAPELAEMTDEQMLESYRTFVANSGTYEMEGNRITTHVVVARVPNFVGETAEYRYRIEQGTLWLTQVDEEGVETLTKLMRLE